MQQTQGANIIKVSAGYGRLYVTGPAYRKAAPLPGATLNITRAAYELSLTLETLRALRKQMGVDAATFATFCTSDVLNWAAAAGRSEKYIRELHERLSTGWRMEFPWEDVAGHPVTGEYRPPFDHQKVMATVSVLLDGVANLGDMGTGKTRATLEAIRYKLENDHLDVVIVCCPKKPMHTWKDQVATFTPSLRLEVLTGSVRTRGMKIKSWKGAPFDPQILVLNHDVLYLLEDEIRNLAKKYRVGLVIDEMHRFRNPQTKGTKAMMRLANEVSWRVGMTGSPILQGPQDLWSQWYFVDMGLEFGANFVQYKREFLDEDPYLMKLIPKPGTLELIGNRMRRRGLRYTKEECMDLPPKIYESLRVEMSRDQARAYRQMEHDLVALLTSPESERQEYATASNQLAAILRLTQITSGFVPNEDGTMHRFQPNPKLDALEELIEEQIGQQQIIVWARYTEDIASICERLRSYRPLVIVGSGAEPQIRARGINFPAWGETEKLFNSGQHRLLVANPAAGGAGLNLQAASLAIYYSQGYNLEHRIQSEDRCHRGGSEVHNRVTYIDLHAEGTIDEVITDALRGKKSVADAVVDLRRHLGI